MASPNDSREGGVFGVYPAVLFYEPVPVRRGLVVRAPRDSHVPFVPRAILLTYMPQTMDAAMIHVWAVPTFWARGEIVFLPHGSIVPRADGHNSRPGHGLRLFAAGKNFDLDATPISALIRHLLPAQCQRDGVDFPLLYWATHGAPAVSPDERPVATTLS